MRVLHHGRGPRGIERLVWPARRLRNRLRSAWLWRRQGRPVDEPIVVRQGRIVSCRHGYYLVTNWHWDFRYLFPGRTGQVVWDADTTVDRYTARYGVERVAELGCCPVCQATVTA